MIGRLVQWLARALFRIPRLYNDDGSENVNYAADAEVWRLKVAGGLVLMSLSNIALFAIVGWLILTTARAGDVDEVKAQMIAEKIEKVSTTICMAEPGTIDVQLRAYQQRLQETYRDLTMEYYDAPPCEILLKLRD